MLLLRWRLQAVRSGRAQIPPMPPSYYAALQSLHLIEFTSRVSLRLQFSVVRLRDKIGNGFVLSVVTVLKKRVWCPPRRESCGHLHLFFFKGLLPFRYFHHFHKTHFLQANPQDRSFTTGPVSFSSLRKSGDGEVCRWLSQGESRTPCMHWRMQALSNIRLKN